MGLRVALVLSATVILPVALSPSPDSVDFSSCASALDEVAPAAEDAAGKARDAESAEDEFQSEKEEYDRCRRFPDIYDHLEDGCRSRRRDAEDAQGQLESAVTDLKSALDELQSAMSGVQRAHADSRLFLQRPYRRQWTQPRTVQQASEAQGHDEHAGVGATLQVRHE